MSAVVAVHLVVIEQEVVSEAASDVAPAPAEEHPSDTMDE